MIGEYNLRRENIRYSHEDTGGNSKGYISKSQKIFRKTDEALICLGDSTDETMKLLILQKHSRIKRLEALFKKIEVAK